MGGLGDIGGEGGVTDFDRPARPFLPTLLVAAAGGLFCLAPDHLDRRVRAAVCDLAGPALSALPRGTASAGDPSADEEDAVAALAAELARVRATDRGDALLRPGWLRVRRLGAAGDRDAVHALLVAAEGPAAGADAAVLTGDSPVVDAGADRQVRAGDLAVVRGCVAGRVASVGRHTAAVRPIGDETFRLAVTVAGAAGVLAGGAAPTVRFLPPAAAVRTGVTVACDAAETGGPPLAVAVVTSAERTPAGGWAVAVRPLALLSEGTGELSLVRAELNRRRVRGAE